MVSYEALLVLLNCAALCGISTCFTHPNDVDALLAVKRGFIDNSNNLDNWRGDDPCGGWTGVFCMLAPCNVSYEKDHLAYYVSELRLSQFNLSGQLAPEIGNLGQLQTLNLMWNRLSGSIPASIGNIKYLRLLLLNGNQFVGVIPPELGLLPNLTRLQLDENRLSGPFPATFFDQNLPNIQHLHLNNNSLSGNIPPALSTLTTLQHLLLDSNSLTGTLPVEISRILGLLIIQLDNNRFDSGATIPAEYGTMTSLVKLSLRNCNLRGQIPDFSSSTNLMVLDLSHNVLTGPFSNKSLPPNLTTVDLSFNQLSGALPGNVGALSSLLSLELRHNRLSSDIPSNVVTGLRSVKVLDLQDNLITGFANSSDMVNLQTPGNSSLWLSGNPFCKDPLLLQNSTMCVPQQGNVILGDGIATIVPFALESCCAGCPVPYSLAPNEQSDVCTCKVPIYAILRLKSPSFGVFDPFLQDFAAYLAFALQLTIYQVRVKDYTSQPGPRFLCTVLFFANGIHFEDTEVSRIHTILANWKVPSNNTFGPYELISFQPPSSKGQADHHGLSSGAIAGIVLGVLTFVVLKTLCMYYFLASWIHQRLQRDLKGNSRRVGQLQSMASRSVKVSGVRSFSFEEMKRATDGFGFSRLVGQGGYGKVYSGILEDGQHVAIKRAEEGSHQGSREFETEILLLSRVHHRNLVSLVGYCVEQGEQMLVYEFIAYGSLYYHLTAPSAFPLNFTRRLQVAVGSARGIHYLHTEADPPIYHRDVKASNILLDETFQAKVADFGLSKLAPQPDLEGMVGYISTVVKGTPGYLDPEYFKTHRLTDKSDVYSFGVLLLVLFTGMQPISEGRNLVREVTFVVEEGKLSTIIDSRIGGDHPWEILEDLVNLALRCCQDAPALRPSITEVVADLERFWKDSCSNLSTVKDESDFTAFRAEKVDSSHCAENEKDCNACSPSTEKDYAFDGELLEKDYISFSADMLGNESEDFFIEIKPSVSSPGTSSNTWTDSYQESSTDDMLKVDVGIHPR